MTYVERCLYEYKTNCAAIDIAEDERRNLMSVHSQNYNSSPGGFGFGNGASDPVFDITARRITLEERIKKLECRVKPVERLREDLKGKERRYTQLRQVLELKFINHEGNQETQRIMAVSDATFWRRVRELLDIARNYFRQV